MKSRGGRPGLLVPNSPYSLCGRHATQEHQVPTVHTVSVDVKQHWNIKSLTIRTVSVDVKQHWNIKSLTVRTMSVDVKQHWNIKSSP